MPIIISEENIHKYVVSLPFAFTHDSLVETLKFSLNKFISCFKNSHFISVINIKFGRHH